MTVTALKDELLLPEIMRIENASFSPPWSEKSVETELISDDTVFLAALENETKLLGFVIAKCAFDEAELYQIAVAPECRRNGYADALMKALFTELKKHGTERLFLEVRKSNLPAVSLYEKYGFAALCVRKNYYTAPVEDALIMEKRLDPEPESSGAAKGEERP